MQQVEVRNTLDSLLQLQGDMERKNRERKETNNEFYSSLISENRNLLNSIREGRRTTLPPNLIHDRSVAHNSININQINQMGQANQTPYEQKFGVKRDMREIPNIHHESVFINAETPQPNIQSTNEVLDDLINSYQPGANPNDNFTLPVPQTSLQLNGGQEDQPYNDNIIDVEENETGDIDAEDSLNKLVDEVEATSINDKLQQQEVH